MLSTSALDMQNLSSASPSNVNVASPLGSPRLGNSMSSHQHTPGGVGGSSSQIGEIHSLYQDLFLTDIKKEVETAKQELKTSKQDQNSAFREL